jgi:hypothetical protein
LGSEVNCHTYISDSSADFGAGRIAAKSGREFEAETDALTDLCQTQVNYWHSESPMTDDQISVVKKIAKITILQRHRGSIAFVNLLKKG